jgi:hypothetical protein
MKLHVKLIAAIIAATFAILPGFSQKVALKSNMLSDVLLSPDLGIEFALAPKWSLDINGNAVLWNNGDRRFRHWTVMPEARYWLCQRFHGHFFGLHAIAGQYNVGNIGHDFPILGFKDLASKRYQGWMGGAGIAYGYDWLLSEHWNLEAEIGAGWIHTRSDVYPCAECGNKLDSGYNRNYFGLTKLALNIVYLF